MRPAHAASFPLLLVGLVWILLQQGPGSNQNVHFALVRSISDGTPRVDRYKSESPDVSYIDGHYYAAKAPGLALLTEPWYLALEGSGGTVEDDAWRLSFPAAMEQVPRPALWQLSIFGAALPALICLFLVSGVADRLLPGRGTAAAVLLGLGSTLGVFATLFFAHALSASLGFAAFALLVRERSRPNLALVSCAGVVAGLAIVVEFPLALVAAVLAGFVAVHPDRWRRLAAYGLGGAFGVAPLAGFNSWAFGSPWTLSYTDAVVTPGRSGHDVIGANSAGFFGVEVPSLRAGLELLASSKGLLVLTPVWALSVAGIALLWRRGSRAEAAVIAAVGIAFVVYDSAYYLPFGGFPGGPRFLVPMLPFLAVAVAAAASAVPLTALTLGLASVTVTVVALLVDPGRRSEDAGSWFHALERGSVTQTVVGWAGGSDRVGVAIAAVAAVAAVLFAVVAVVPGQSPPATTGHKGGFGRGFTRRDVIGAVTALVLWRVVYIAGPVLLESPGSGGLDLVAVVALLAAVGAALFLLARAGGFGLVAAVALLPLAWPRFAAHDRLALIAVGCSLAVSLAVLRGRGLPRPPRDAAQRAAS
jgi:hypothetical protein